MDDPKQPALGEHWKEELASAKKWLAKWHKSGEEILKRLKDEREEEDGGVRANYFASGYLTQRAILYGKTPSAAVDRRWKDPADDLARVGGEMLGRSLNDDIASGADGYARALGYVVENALSVGMGLARVRYEVEPEEVPREAADGGMAANSRSASAMLGPGAPPSDDTRGDEARDVGAAPQGDLPDGTAAIGAATPPGSGGRVAIDIGAAAAPAVRKVREACLVDYVYWKDFLWSPCGYWEVVRWVAFKAELSRKALIRRFDPKRFPTVRVSGDAVRLDTAQPKNGAEAKPERARDRATVWEIWDKEAKETVWCTEGGQVLDVQPDPLGLTNFFPCPRPLFSFVTTDELIPRPDFVLAQDLYDELDSLESRMKELRDALRLVGVYDADNTALADLLGPNARRNNEMVPVKNWAMLAEKGGLAAAVDYFPVQQVAAVLTSLAAEHEALKNRLYEITGLSDIMRGQASAIATTLGEQKIKAQFGSARLQAKQEEFGRFATELQALKAEVISRHFDPETIVQASNMDKTKDADVALEAAHFLKDQGQQFRIKVQPESLASADFAQVKEERSEVVMALGRFVSAVTPMVQMMPASTPLFLDIFAWMIASMRGASEIEGVLDEAISAFRQAQQQPPQGEQPPPPDPKLVLAQFQAQAKERQIALESEARQKEIVTETAADTRREVVQREQNVLEAFQKLMLEMGWRPPDSGGQPPPIAPPPVPPGGPV